MNPMGDVVKLQLVEVGENFRFDAEHILDAAKEQKFERLMVLGELEDGAIYVGGTANLGETLVLIEKAKHMLVFGKDGSE